MTQSGPAVMIKLLHKYFKYGFLGALLFAATLIWYAVLRETRSGLLTAFSDIGQGDAIFIQADNGNQILVDGGPNKKILSELSKIMPFYDRTMDAVILTHPHADHLNGLIEVLKKYKVGAVLESGAENPDSSAAYEELQKIIQEKNIAHYKVKRGTRLNISEGLTLNILLPIFNLKNGDVHDQMVVGKLNYGKTSFFLTGDMEANLEEYLVFLEKENLKSDILKVGHHGSQTSTSETFLGYISPKYAVIQNGAANKYGHPHQEILERLNKFGVKIFRNDLDGLIRIRSDGEEIFIF